MTPLYVFSLHARRRGAVRLEAYGEGLEELLTWLRRIEHPTARHLDRRIFAFQNVDRLHVACDADSEGWSPRVGLEGSFRRWPHRESGWHKLVHRLIEEGLCEPEKGAAIWQWPGYESAPGGFRVRALSHLKLDFQPGVSLQAKAYLLLQWLRR